MSQPLAPILLLLILIAAPPAVAAPPPGQVVQLPFTLPDDAGSTWDVQHDGSIGDGGNDLYDGGGRLLVNNATQYLAPTQQATLDPAGVELTLPPISVDGLTISRRVAVLKSLATVRFTEIVENPTASPARVRLRCNFDMGQGVQQLIPLTDERRRDDGSCGYAVSDAVNAVAVVHSGRGAKLHPQFSAQPGADDVSFTYDLTIPAKQTAAVVHFQIRRPSAEIAADAWRTLKEKDLLADLPRELRRNVVNFARPDALVGDRELLRGGALDIVELRGRRADTYRGTLTADAFRLHTLYGTVTIPAARVAGVLSTGAFRPAQLVVTRDGEVFAGHLDAGAIALRMTGGQVTSIPLPLVSRIGYRRQPGEPDEWTFENRPTAHLRSGERLFIRRPDADVHLATPAGPLRLPASVVASIALQTDRSTVPEVRLTDGTRLAALPGATSFDLVLAGPDATLDGARARVPASALLRLDYAAQPDRDALAPALTLTNGDTLVGTIAGTLSLETPFDTLHVEGDQIKSIDHPRAGGVNTGGDHDLRVTLWDDSVVSGRLTEARLTCRLRCGVLIGVPLPLLGDYRQPLPTPSPAVIRRIHSIARKLDADDWHARDAAQATLFAMGPPVMSVLRQLQPRASIEAARRMDLIVDALAQQLEPKSRPLAGPRPVTPVFQEAPMPWH